MINRVVLVGRITKELELKKTPSGASMCTYTIAVNRNRNVDGQPDADFISCETWNRQAENMVQFLHKGSLIGIEGRINTRTYNTNNGQKVYSTY
ncbi:MAG: single-stranded DNA-binding protein, partial [Floccifex sp.]